MQIGLPGSWCFPKDCERPLREVLVKHFTCYLLLDIPDPQIGGWSSPSVYRLLKTSYFLLGSGVRVQAPASSFGSTSQTEAPECSCRFLRAFLLPSLYVVLSGFPSAFLPPCPPVPTSTFLAPCPSARLEVAGPLQFPSVPAILLISPG